MVLRLWPLSAQNVTVQQLYADALAKERAVRTALADQDAIPTTIKAARTVVGDFEAIVRRYPASGYGDDALWHAGQLALDTFRKFGDEHEKAAAVRLLRALAEYPMAARHWWAASPRSTSLLLPCRHVLRLPQADPFLGAGERRPGSPPSGTSANRAAVRV